MNNYPEAPDCVNTIVLFVNTRRGVFSETLMDQVFWTTSPLTFPHIRPENRRDDEWNW